MKVKLVLALGTAQVLAWGSTYYLLAILAEPISAELGVRTPWVFGALSAGLILAAFLGPTAGRLIDIGGGRSVLAASSLVFAAGQTADNRPHLFAIDKKTGKRVGAVATPRLGQYGLMTYVHNGKQYVVLPVNGGYTALALP